MKKRLEYVLKHNPYIMRLFMAVGSIFLRFLGLFVKTDERMMLFTSFSGKQYNDSPRAIYEYLRSHPEGDGFRYVWAFEHPEGFPELDCEKVKIDTWKYFITSLRAKYWITSVNIERGLKYKKPSTVYLNTWHGASINLVGNAVEGRSDFNWNHVDYFCISGEYERHFVERDFCLRPESVLLSGLPRNDALYYATVEKKEALRRKFNIPDGKKVILYAPTWRESTDGGSSCTLKPPIDLENWEKTLGKDYVLMVRAHVNTRQLLGLEYGDFVRNGSDEPIVNDLLILADYLISDYSSIILDYSILGRPIVCFAYDFDEYSSSRGFYFDLDKELPSGICRSEAEVLRYIIETDYDEACRKARAFRDSHMQVGGKATEICVEKLLGKGNCAEATAGKA